MTEGHTYTVTTGKSRLETRDIVRFCVTENGITRSEGNRTFVPFSGFDGQTLAGSGALVFEGELLELKN